MRLEPGEPSQASSLSLVFETNAFYEADMLETLLRNEGIPCLKIPSGQALLWPAASASPLTRTRLFVRADMALAASELLAEVTGGDQNDA
jgi:hypothetical protein